jgi:hypothetical protein
VRKISASFRVMGPTVDPVVVSEVLGLEPHKSHKAGSIRVDVIDRVYPPFKEGLWLISSTVPEDASLNEHLEDLLSHIQKSKVQIWKLKDLGYRIDLFIGLFGTGGNSGTSISSSNIQTIANLNIDIDFDIYSR